MPKIIIGVVLVLILAGILYFIVTGNSKKPASPIENNKQTSQEVKTSEQPAPTPSPVVVSHPVEAVISTARGMVTEVTSDSIKVQVDGKVQAYSITNTQDFQRITSGTIEKGDPKYTPAQKTDIKVGQEVYMIVDINSSKARSIYIVK